MTKFTRTAVAALLQAATGAPARPANAAVGLARLDKLLRARGIDIEQRDAAALLVRYADRVTTPEATWTALLALAPQHEAPPVPSTPHITSGHTVEEQAAIAAAPTAARTDAQCYRLPAPGTKQRIAFDLMRRPGGATNKAICTATGINNSWAVDGRRWAECYGLTFTQKTATGPNGYKLTRYFLTGIIPGEDETAA